MKLYLGIANNGVNTILVVDLGSTPSPRHLISRLDLMRANATGYLWGTRAPGCLLTAVSLLADLCEDDELAKQYGPSFAEQIVERLRGDAWIMTAEQLLFGLVGAQQQVYAAEKHLPGVTVQTSSVNQPEPVTFNGGVSP